MHSIAALLLAAAAAATLAAAPGAPLEFVAADPEAPEVTHANLLASERFWPYQVALREAWTPVAGGAALGAGTLGVLVRLDAAGLASLDFGRDGTHVVPVEKTDVVERANRVRVGDLWKPAPNLVHALGRRLVDAAAEDVRMLPFEEAFEPPGFLLVFADPGADGFPALAAALAPLRGRHGVMTILVPQGAQPDLGVTAARLRALAWPVPFVAEAYADGYTRSLLGPDVARPAVRLHTREGRLLFASAWTREAAAGLAAALDGAFAGALAAGGGVSAPRSP